jgi:hypothetical protein
MHHPPNFRRPNPPSLPSQLATTALPSPPALPYEIFINILGQLRDDKPSLVKCMRVSSTFNTFTAPILYSSVILNGGMKNPYDTTQGSPVAARLSSDAAANVDMIKHVIVLSHPSIRLVKGLMTTITNVDSIRVTTTILYHSQDCYQCRGEMPHLHTGSFGCVFFRMIQPKKLVVSGSRAKTCLHDTSGYKALNTVVFIIASTPSIKTDTRFKHPSPPSTAGIKKIVLVLWTDNPSQVCGTVVDSDGTGRHFQAVQLLSFYIQDFVAGIKWHITHHTQLAEIVIVSTQQIHPLALSLPHGSSARERDVRVEAPILTMLKTFTGAKTKHRPDSISMEYEKQNIEIKFISLQDYLKTYDWSGEFTPDEVKPWL